jgi:hypothetical protein
VEAGRPPASLDALPGLALFDAVIAGAPESLAAGDVAGLERFLRERGGSVVLLLDRMDPAGPIDRLLGLSGWGSEERRDGVPLVAADPGAGSLRTAELAWPRQPPAGARPLTAGPAGQPPIVWQAPAGAGRVVVSGALDAWRYRDADAAGFDRFWQYTVASAAGATPPALAVTLDRAVVAPGDVATFRVSALDAALLAPNTLAVRSDVAFRRAAATSANAVEWRSTPITAGTHTIEVTAAGHRASATLMAREGARPATPDERHLVNAWTTSRGGVVVSASDLDSLPDRIREALGRSTQSDRWRPMRSAWWIVPFAAALGTEWWLRRRRGAR